MSWSRLLDTPLGQNARAEYQADPARHYHNWSHVQRLYWHATHTFDLDYDADLDMAILAHDVIYDALPEKEKRSAIWLRDNAAVDTKAAEVHIHKTIDHRVTDDNRMVLLDLADFLYPEKSTINLDNIAKESQALYNVSDAGFLQVNLQVMTALHDRIADGLPGQATTTEQQKFADILAGMKRNLGVVKDRLAATCPTQKK